MYRSNLKSVALPVPEIIVIGVLGFGLGLRTSNLRNGGRIGGRESWGMVPSERALVSSYRTSIQIIHLQHSFPINFRLEFWVGVAKPKSWGRGGRRGPGWYRSKERW